MVIKLNPPPGEFASAVVGNQEAWLGVFSEPGVQAYSLATGQGLGRKVKPGRGPGEVMHPVVGQAGHGLAVADGKKLAIMLFSPANRLVREALTGGTGGACSFTGPAAFFAGAVVGFGGCNPEAVGGREGVYLFAASLQGGLRPLLWWAPPRSPSEHLALAAAGGVLPADPDTLVAVEPFTYRFFRFDQGLRLSGSFQGSRARFHEPSLASLPRGADRDSYFHWRHAQPLVLGLLPLSGGRGLAVLRVPTPEGSAYWGECYELGTGKLLSAQKLEAPAARHVAAVLAQNKPGEPYAWLFFRQSFRPAAACEAWAYPLAELCLVQPE